jgi:hypothetical protein
MSFKLECITNKCYENEKEMRISHGSLCNPELKRWVRNQDKIFTWTFFLSS